MRQGFVVGDPGYRDVPQSHAQGLEEGHIIRGPPSRYRSAYDLPQLTDLLPHYQPPRSRHHQLSALYPGLGQIVDDNHVCPLNAIVVQLANVLVGPSHRGDVCSWSKPVAVDHSASALKQAMEELKGKRNSAVQFVQSRVEQLSESLKESVDTIVFCNAIHYISDKDALVEEISKSLKPGGMSFDTPRESNRGEAAWHPTNTHLPNSPETISTRG